MKAAAKRLLTISEFSDEYGPCRARVYELLHAGQLRAVKEGRKTYLTVEAAEEWRLNLPSWKPLIER